MAQITPSVAFGLGLRILAAGPAHVRLYSCSGAYVNQTSKVCLAAGILVPGGRARLPLS